MNKKILNMVLITLSYLISTTFNIAFLFGLLFYNRAQTSNDSTTWSILFTAFFFPGALINIIAGTVADSYSKRRTMYLSEIVSFLSLMLFVLMFHKGFNTTPYLAIYLATISISFAFFQVPLDASLINICDDKLAEKLVSILWISRAIANTVGPILGYRMSFSFIKMLFIINALSSLLSIILQYFIEFNERKIYPKQISILTNVVLKINHLSEYIKENRIIGFLFSVNLVIAFFYSPIFGAIAPAMTNSLNLGNETLSYIEGAKWSGIIISSIIVAIIGSGSIYLKNLFNFMTLQGFFIMLWLFPLFFNVDVQNMSYIFIFLSIADGMLLTFENLGALTFFQIKIPENIRGSLLGTMRTVMKISGPIGIALYGLLLKYFDWHILISITFSIILLSGIFLRKNKVFDNFIKSI